MFFYYFATIMLLQKVRFPFLLGEGLVLAHSWWCSKNHILQGLKPGPSTCKAHVLDHQVLPLTIRSCGSTYIIAQLNPFTQQGTHTLHKRSLQQHPPRTWPPHNTFLFCFGATPGSAQSLSWNVLGITSGRFGEYVGCWGLKLGQSYARQTSYMLYCGSGPHLL